MPLKIRNHLLNALREFNRENESQASIPALDEDTRDYFIATADVLFAMERFIELPDKEARDGLINELCNFPVLP